MESLEAPQSGVPWDHERPGLNKSVANLSKKELSLAEGGDAGLRKVVSIWAGIRSWVSVSDRPTAEDWSGIGYRGCNAKRYCHSPCPIRRGRFRSSP